MPSTHPPHLINPVISPSLLSCDFANMESELKALEEVNNIWIHLDVMDGHFVPNLTFGIPVIERISQVTHQPLDAHLMVTNPELHLEKMQNFGLHNITFHYEAMPDPLAFIRQSKGQYPSLGISIRPETPTSLLSDEMLQYINLVLVMSVNPGLGGQSFLPSALEKIAMLKTRRSDLAANFSIQVDGGINEDTAKHAIAAGADNLVAGSYVFKATPQDYQNRIEQLRSSLRS